MASHRLFGLSLESGHRFRTPLPAGEWPPDLRFEIVDQPPFEPVRASAAPIYVSAFPAADGASRMQLYRTEGCDVLHLHGFAQFFVFPDRIACHILDPRHAYVAEIGLLGAALSLWLERRGIAAVHGSALDLPGGTAVFLAPSTSGKSSLAAIGLSLGDGLLTDDLLPIEEEDGVFWGRPGYPQLRLRPDVLRHLNLPARALPRLFPGSPKRCQPVGPYGAPPENGFGRFVGERQPLRALYLPVREKGRQRVEIEPVPRRETVIELVRNSFVPRLVEALGLGPRRLDLFARLALQVPMLRLRYPSDLARLPEVRAAVIDDLASRAEAR